MRPVLLALVFAACAAKEKRPDVARIAEPVVGKRSEGGEVIGKSAPPFEHVAWVDGQAHPLSEDRGKVVLVRWWTDTCPLCRNSARAFAALKEKYGDDLVVRAVYHNKVSGREVSLARTERFADETGFPWLVGKDPEWRDLRRWWLDGGDRSYTSVTFLLGKQGRIRLVHTGGEFHARDQVPASECLFDPAQCDAEYRAIDQAIALLAAE